MNKNPEWDGWIFEEEDPFLHDLDDPNEEPKKFTPEELIALFGEIADV